MFLDDSDFRKAKRALLITSSIALLIGLANIKLEELNFAIVKLTVESAAVIHLFIIAVILYQSIILYNRARNHFSSKELTSNKEALGMLRKGGDLEDYKIELEQHYLNLEQKQAKYDAILEDNEGISNDIMRDLYESSIERTRIVIIKLAHKSRLLLIFNCFRYR